MTVPAFPAAPTGQRRKALLQLAILSLLVVALSVPLSPSEVIGAGFAQHGAVTVAVV